MQITYRFQFWTKLLDLKEGVSFLHLKTSNFYDYKISGLKSKTWAHVGCTAMLNTTADTPNIIFIVYAWN